MPKMNRRKYTGILPYFHNFEHSSKGLNHCSGGANNPYTIRHSKGKHVIDREYARGHGKSGKTQWFRFTKKLDGGYDMKSGMRVELSKVPSRYK